MFNFTVMEHLSHRRPLLNMAAPWLEGQADLSPVAVRVSFPDGSTFEGRSVVRHGEKRHQHPNGNRSRPCLPAFRVPA